MQHPLFEDGCDLPLFTLTPIPVPDPRVVPATHAPDQPLLLEPACRTCFDGGEIRVGTQVRFCWCPAGQEVRCRKVTPQPGLTNHQEDLS